MKFWREPLDADSATPPHGQVHIIIDRCKGCGFCIKYCPCQVLEFADEFNSKGYHPPIAVKPEACVDCGLCEVMCPEFAIWVTTDEESEPDEKSKPTEKEPAVGKKGQR